MLILGFLFVLFLQIQAQVAKQRDITKISFGSCNKQNLDQPLWKKIENYNPDLWIWLGINNFFLFSFNYYYY
jgi:alkaline phosphatase D